MLNIKKSKALDLRRFGKNAYVNDVANGGGAPAIEPNFNGHEYVDLGLPSGTLWATMSIGAESETTPGALFAWGETTAKTGFYSDDYKYGNDHPYSKYDADEKTILDPQDDAAIRIMGGDWRMPTYEQFAELVENTTISLETIDGKYVYKATSNINGRVLMFPEGGGVYEDSPDAGNAYFWSSELIDQEDWDYKEPAALSFFPSPEEDYHYLGTGTRYCGNQVRGVIIPGQTNPTIVIVTECGLADALTKTFYWNIQSLGSGGDTHLIPNAFLFIGSQLNTSVCTLESLITTSEGLVEGTQYIPESNASAVSVALYTYEECNNLENICSVFNFVRVYPLYEFTSGDGIDGYPEIPNVLFNRYNDGTIYGPVHDTDKYVLYDSENGKVYSVFESLSEG